MTDIQRLYLSSLESTRFEPVRECSITRFLAFDTGKAAAVADIDPAVIGQDFGLGTDISTVILTARHAGTSVDAIDAFPFFVFIAIPAKTGISLATPIRDDDLQIIGWGELYRSADDAANHAFD